MIYTPLYVDTIVVTDGSSESGNDVFVAKLYALCFCQYPGLTVQGILTMLTHWGQVTHICVIKMTIIGSENGLSPGRRQAITWTNAGILLIGPLGTNFIEILIGIQTFSFKKMHLKMSSAKWCPFCLGLNVLNYSYHGSIRKWNFAMREKSLTFRRLHRRYISRSKVSNSYSKQKYSFPVERSV